MSNLQVIWGQMSAAPHRSLFLAGTLQGVLTLIWWSFDLAGRAGLTDGAPVWSILPIWVHAFLMIYAFFPFFILGFLFTTFPNWMNGEKISPRQYMMVSSLMVIGVVLFYIGLIAGEFVVLAGLVAMLMGWGKAIIVLFRVLLTAPAGDKRHAWVAGAAFVAGWFGLGAYLLWILTANGVFLNFSRQAGIWFFLLPILMTVSHRMIPFFSSRVLEQYVIVRPYGLLWLMVGCSIVHGLMQLVDLQYYTWWVDLILAGCAFYLSYAWGFFRSFSVRLLAVLHVAFAWLGISMLLFALQGLFYWLSEENRYWFGLAPLHALAVGYFASMVLGMASRVTLGHAGRPLVLDAFTWQLFIGFQVATLLRILPDILPIIAFSAPLFHLIAGGIWLSCFALWALKYAPMYWRARADGKAG